MTHQRSEFWPVPSAHRDYWERHNCAFAYEYDPTDDGPEVDVIKAIRASHLLIEDDYYWMFV